MNKRLYNSLDLDQTHIHITKKLLFSSQKPNSLLLSTLQKRNTLISQTISSYSSHYHQILGNQFRSIDIVNIREKEKERDLSRKKRTEFGISKRRLEVISNLLKTEKTRKTIHEQSSTITYDHHMRTKRSRKQFAFPISKFNMSNNFLENQEEVQNQEDERCKVSYHLPSENSQKQKEKENKQKKEKQRVNHIRKIKPLEWKNENGALNTIRYSSLLRTINNQKIFQNYSTKLPDISMVKKSEVVHGRGVFKRVQFA